MPDPSGERGGARLALEFCAAAVRLRRLGPEGWETAGEARLDDPDFPGAAQRLAEIAARLSGGAPAPAELWLPPEQVLAFVAPLKPGMAREAALDAALSGASPVPHQELLIDVAPAPGGLAVAAAEIVVVEEALDYARRWGFAPRRVTTQPGARETFAAFADGPEFMAGTAPGDAPGPGPAPDPGRPPPPASRARRPGAIRLALAGFGAAAALGLAGFFLIGGEEADPPVAPPAPAPLAAAAFQTGPSAPRGADAPMPAALAFHPAAPTPPSAPDAGRAAEAPEAQGADRGAAEPPPVAPPAPPPAPPREPDSSPMIAAAAPSDAPAPASPPAAMAEATAVPEAPEAETESSAESEGEAEGPGAVARAPAPRARPDELDMTPSANVAARAPRPVARPSSIRPAPARQTPPAATAPAAAPPSLDDEEGEEAGIAAAPRRGPPTGAGVAAAATLRGALPLTEMNLIGVVGAGGARRALLRTPDGVIHRVSQGAVIDGWVVSTIEATSMRVTRGAEARTLQLVR